MFDIGGNLYTIDLDALSNVLVIDKDAENKTYIQTEVKEFFDDKQNLTAKDVTTFEKAMVKEIDGPKYDTIRLLFEVIFSFDDDVDESLGMLSLNKASLSFKLAFNTLLEYGIIKEIE
jgi:hypothetical protein